MNDPITTEEVRACLATVLPLRQGDCAIELAGDPPVTEREGALAATLRLIVYEEGQIRDIKEQDVSFLSAKARGDSLERFRMYVDGWAIALSAFLGERDRSAIDALMPHDLVFPAVFELKRPQTPEDFAAAHRTKKRFGKL